MQSNDLKFPKWNFRTMFLRALHKTNLNNFNEFQLNIYRSLLGDVNAILADFISQKLIRNATFFDCVDSTMTVAQLKEFLKLKGLKVSGRKEDLISRASDYFTDDERKKIEDASNMLIITPEGRELINNENERLNEEVDIFQKVIMELLINSEYMQALNYISKFYASYPFPVGISVDWNYGFPVKTREKVVYLMNSNYLTESMNLPDDLNKKIRAVIVTNSLFAGYGIADFDLKKNLLLVMPDFKCEEIEKFLKNRSTEILEHLDWKSQSDVIEVFYNTLNSQAYNAIELKEIMSLKDKRRFDGEQRYKGVEILGGDEKCNKCKGKSSYYEWSKIELLPELPKYPGCNCLYLPIIASQND